MLGSIWITLLSVPLGLGLLAGPPGLSAGPRLGSVDPLDSIAVGPPLVGPTWTVESNHAGSRLGRSVAGAGDVDGDGFVDLIVGAPCFGPSCAGRAWIYFGSPNGPSDEARWSVSGNQPGSELGYAVAGVGDVNGDGYDDVAVSTTASVNVHYGSSHGPSLVPDWMAGVAVRCARGAGDVNGDGFDDLVVGDPYSGEGTTISGGRAYLYLGSLAGLELDPSWTVHGDTDDLQMGMGVSGAGDVNGDGFDDLLIGGPGFTNGTDFEGAAFVYLGSPSGPSTTPDWIGESEENSCWMGWTVCGAGDVNADGYDDVLVGGPESSLVYNLEGRAFLYFGSPSGPSPVADWIAAGNATAAGFGGSLAGSGDVNGDGFDDVLVGAGGPGIGGRVSLFIGSANGPSSEPDWFADGGQPTAGFGVSISGGFDANSDGFADVLVGCEYFDNGQDDEGRAYLYAGHGPTDCNRNGVLDDDDIASGTSLDCDSDWTPDECELASGTAVDCNANGMLDECDIGSGTSSDANANGTPDECELVGTPYCFGDGSGAPCPCGNAGASGSGCANGHSAAGARVAALGSASTAADDLGLFANSSVPSQPGLFFQADERILDGAGLPFGDGLRCAGGNVVRLQVRTADGSGSASTTSGIAATGGASPGDIKRYQWWYRDPTGSPCGTGFNLSNGLEVAWTP